RVSCHFNSIEIPTLGRAFFTTTAAALLTLIIGFLLQSLLVGFEARGPRAVAQFGAFIFALAANLLITTGLYTLLLRVRYSQALTLWLFQAGLFAAFLLVVGCFGGILLSLLGGF